MSFESLDKIKEVKEFTEKNNIELVIYYSPIHITKKIHLYEKGMWNSYQELKRKLVDITPFYDYSFANDYNTTFLDENNLNYVDNIHPANTYNNLIVQDLLSDNKKIGTYVTKDNIDSYLNSDTQMLENYINNNKNLTDSIKNVTVNDANIAIRRKDAV